MKKAYLGLLLILIAAVILILTRNQRPLINSKPEISGNQSPTNQQLRNSPSSVKTTSIFQPPLTRAVERVTKKPFGIYITPADSPIQPERFKGYHTGADFEIFSDELNVAVSVHAICSGKLKLKEFASGYGGVVAQACELNKEPITVIYGHLKLSSIILDVGADINAGEVIGILGADQSRETDGERRHLHLGIHQGIGINIRGYVNSQPELVNWIDPCLYVCHD
jgi:murein DD-endopeptidase MepM/ murein hydrolase activator NlpD